MSNENKWEEPSIKELGDAKDLIKGLNPVWDSKTKATPNDEFSATASHGAKPTTYLVLMYIQIYIYHYRH